MDVDIPPQSHINDRKQDWLLELSHADYKRCMDLLGELLGIPYRYSPEATAAALLRSLHARPGGKPMLPAVMPPPALDPNTEADLHWIREMTAEEKEAPFIVCYDVNAAYLAACSALPLGVGAPRHVIGHPSLGHYNTADVGYFRLQGGWVTTPTLAWRVPSATFWEGYVWDETSRPLEPWYKVLRDARERVMMLRSLQTQLEKISAMRSVGYLDAALQTIKMMYAGFIGRMASTKWDRTGDPLYRPDARHMIIATRRTRVQRAMAQCDPAPFAAYCDQLYFATERTVTGLRMGTNPGTWKIHGTVRNDGAVAMAALEGDLTDLVRLVR